ncbi:hypothetical protein ASE63_03680 [Bosea sp. Root381]|uniref:M81 family metallopeptidase n=1 Tax=Bosea sp. Root381 TaxID=1736524 RepID=UPI0006FEA9FD|nr:M81 family metallopeptidase [Bosea sp. Root381]KRE09647.1 hypothetical protein ASE63_03680 [Bosea sp. Root381]
MARILVGQLWHEGHSFNPVVTDRDEVSILRGDELLAQARQSQTAFSGIVREADRLGHTCVPVLGARARPGGPVAQDLFEEIVAEFVAAARKGDYDAICLELHGATISQDTVDTEGELLQRLREAVGPEMPISVALDLHAYLTERMVANATIITGYRTQPHADMVETGERAMALLDALLKGTPRPTGMVTFIPFLMRGSDETDAEPMRGICAQADEWRSQPGLVDLSIFNIHPFIDGPRAGQAVLAYDDGGDAGERASRALSETLWRLRDRFVETLPGVAEVLSRAGENSGLPYVLGDQGDRVLGAGPGDSVEIARVALEQFPRLAVALPVYDPEAVAAAQAAGAGATLRRAIGASVNPALHPLEAEWQVRRLGRARFVNKGPYMAGVEADFGDYAVLAAGALSVVVTSLVPNAHDPAFYDCVGLPLSSQRAVVARSANHYKLSFAGVAIPVTVDTAGMTAFRPQDLPFDKIRPVYPLDEVHWDFEGGFMRLPA